MSRLSRFQLVCALLAGMVAIQLNLRLERHLEPGLGRHSLYLPSGSYLEWASLGHRQLLADVLYVWSIQYYSTPHEEPWRYLSQLYDVITDLDPHFVMAYVMGALILGLEAKAPGAAIGLLEKGIEANPDTYVLAWEAGFHARDMGNLKEASRFFAVAKDKPGAPSYVARWHAYTVNRLGDRLQALALWQEVLESARNEYERQVAERHVLQTTLEIQLEALRKAIRAFETREGRLPFSLAELVKTGDLGVEPLDPRGKPFRYDRQTGEVESVSGILPSRSGR